MAALAAKYHDAFAALTTQAIEPLLDAADVVGGTRLLDVATGPGYVAGVAAPIALPMPAVLAAATAT